MRTLTLIILRLFVTALLVLFCQAATFIVVIYVLESLGMNDLFAFLNAIVLSFLLPILPALALAFLRHVKHHGPPATHFTTRHLLTAVFVLSAFLAACHYGYALEAFAAVLLAAATLALHQLHAPQDL